MTDRFGRTIDYIRISVTDRDAAVGEDDVSLGKCLFQR